MKSPNINRSRFILLVALAVIFASTGGAAPSRTTPSQTGARATLTQPVTPTPTAVSAPADLLSRPLPQVMLWVATLMGAIFVAGGLVTVIFAAFALYNVRNQAREAAEQAVQKATRKIDEQLQKYVAAFEQYQNARVVVRDSISRLDYAEELVETALSIEPKLLAARSWIGGTFTYAAVQQFKESRLPTDLRFEPMGRPPGNLETNVQRGIYWLEQALQHDNEADRKLSKTFLVELYGMLGGAHRHMRRYMGELPEDAQRALLSDTVALGVIANGCGADSATILSNLQSLGTPLGLQYPWTRATLDAKWNERNAFSPGTIWQLNLWAIPRYPIETQRIRDYPSPTVITLLPGDHGTRGFLRWQLAHPTLERQWGTFPDSETLPINELLDGTLERFFVLGPAL